MNVIFWGTPEYSVESLNRIYNSDHTILAVVSQPDKKRSRGNKLYPSPIKRRAIDLGLKVFTPDNIRKDIAMKKELLNIKNDINIVIAFGQILPEELLENPKYGSWNAHASLLPNWRGAAPIQRSILNGDKETGVGIMYMEKGLDTGPILLQEKVEIGINDNFNVLCSKLSKLSSDLLLKSLTLIEKADKDNKEIRLDTLKVIDQNDISSTYSYASTIKKEELKIDWNYKALEVHRKIMAFYPNSYTIFRNKRIKILDSELINKTNINYINIKQCLNDDKYNSYHNGDIIQILKSKGLVIKTEDYPLMIKEIQVEGKKPAKENNLIQQLKANIGDSFKE